MHFVEHSCYGKGEYTKEIEIIQWDKITGKDKRIYKHENIYQLGLSEIKTVIFKNDNKSVTSVIAGDVGGYIAIFKFFDENKIKKIKKSSKYCLFLLNLIYDEYKDKKYVVDLNKFSELLRIYNNLPKNERELVDQCYNWLRSKTRLYGKTIGLLKKILQ